MFNKFISVLMTEKYWIDFFSILFYILVLEGLLYYFRNQIRQAFGTENWKSLIKQQITWLYYTLKGWIK